MLSILIRYSLYRRLRDFLIQSGYSESKVSTIFPAPVDLESLQIVNQEDAACEKLLILYDSGNFPSFIQNNGYLVSPRDLGELREKTLYLLDNPKTAKEMGKRGRQIVTKYDIQMLGEKLLNIYKNIIEES